ncbi:MAG TPA: hypothetical protein VGX92_03180 [Pyrinomonadaceae bacterium]|nr:hypothetical protein [Pyrinomonadaceae bacterium]
MKIGTNPYVGPRPFEKDEKLLFHGRDGEANELFSLISAHPVVLFYSQSGAGKTSLLNARIVPELEKQHAQVFGIARVGGKLPKGIEDKKIDNVFVFNALWSLQGKDTQFTPESLSRMSLAHYLKLQKRDGQSKYFYPLHVVIFDQFEELFTSFQEHWEKQESFFLNISQAFKEDPLLRVVFAMREEYIAALDPFAQMLPQRLQKRFRLERLREDAALSAVVNPLDQKGLAFGPGVAEQLVNNLMQIPIKHSGKTVSTTGEFAEPVQLQIVCQSLWDELPMDVEVIDERAAARFGDVDTALAKYYDDCLKKVVQTYLDVDEGKLRLWFEKSLVTPIRTRGTVYMDEGRTEDNLSEKVVMMLEEGRLIRAELRGGAKWYELTHDRFIEPILKSNKAWFGLPSAETLIYALEMKASEWVNKGKSPDDLLTDDLLLEARKSRERRRTMSGSVVESEILKDYINASEIASEKRKRKQLRRRVSVTALLSIVGIVLLLIAIISGMRAAQTARERRAKQVDRGAKAKDYAVLKGMQYNALAFGIEAVGLSAPNDAPPEAVEGLRKALATVDRKVWLREGVATSAPNRLEMAEDGNNLALSVNNNELCVWNTRTGQKIFGYQRPEAGEWKQVGFSPNGNLVFAVITPLPLMDKPGDKPSNRVEQGEDKPGVKALGESIVGIFEAQSGVESKTLEEKLKGAQSVQISDDGKHILADFGSVVRIVGVDSGDVVTPAPSSQRLWDQITLSPDGSRLVAVYAGSRVELLATDSDNVVGSFSLSIQKKSGMWDSIAFSKDGRRGVLVRPSTTPGEMAGIVWDNTSGQRLATLRGKVEDVDDVAFSPDGRSVVAFGKKRAETFDAATGNSLASYQLPEREIVLHSGMNIVALENGQGTCSVSVRDALTGNARAPAQTYAAEDKIIRAATTPAADRVITSDDGKVIQIWTLADPLAVEELSGEELLTEACERLRDHKEEYERVSGICAQRLSAPATGR